MALIDSICQPAPFTSPPLGEGAPFRCQSNLDHDRELPVAAKLEQRVEERHQQSKRMFAHSRAKLGDRRGEIADGTNIGGLEHDRAKEAVAAIRLATTPTIAFAVARGRNQRDAKSAGNIDRPD